MSHKQDLLAVARGRSGCREDAEDAVADAMLRAVTYDDLDEDRIGAWMTRTLVNLCTDNGRDHARRPQRHAYSIRMSLPAPGPEEQVTERLHAAYATGQVDALPGAQREAVLLKASGIPVGDVASQMGLGYKATESLLSRARATLRLSLVAGVGAVFARAARRASTTLPVAGFALAATTAALVATSPGQSPARPSSESEVVSGTEQTDDRRRPSASPARRAAVPARSEPPRQAVVERPERAPAAPPPPVVVDLERTDPVDVADSVIGTVEDTADVDTAATDRGHCDAAAVPISVPDLCQGRSPTAVPLTLP